MENEILIFRTSITRRLDIKRVGKVLNSCCQIKKWNVDFEDWEKILRIECNGINAEKIIALLKETDDFLIRMA